MNLGVNQSGSVGTFCRLLSPEAGPAVDQLLLTEPLLTSLVGQRTSSSSHHLMKTVIIEAETDFERVSKSIHVDFQQENNTDECPNSENVCICVSATVFSLYWGMLWFASVMQGIQNYPQPLHTTLLYRTESLLLPCSSAGCAAAQWTSLPRLPLLMWLNQGSNKASECGTVSELMPSSFWGRKKGVACYLPLLLCFS